MRGSLLPRAGGPESSGGTGPRSRCLVHVAYDWPMVDGTTGRLLSITGQEWTWSRGASTSQTATDSDGVSYTAVAALPAWEGRDWGSTGARDHFGLRCGTNDRLTCDVVPPPQALSGMIEFIETGAVSTADATLFAIANDTVTGARLALFTNGTSYGVEWTDGTTIRTARPPGTPAVNDRVRVWWSLSSTGALDVRTSINGGTETTATAAALTLPAAWGTAARMRLNSRGDTENPGQMWFYRLKLAAGVVDATTLSARW